VALPLITSITKVSSNALRMNCPFMARAPSLSAPWGLRHDRTLAGNVPGTCPTASVLATPGTTPAESSTAAPLRSSCSKFVDDGP